ncbi:MAG: EcsC family protein [Verrucomicrobiota bacterium]|nr:EcsC family protein [Verrucomicrobiota bacterium]
MEESKPLRYTPLSQAELEELRFARSLLENPGLAARLSDTLGTPIEKGLKMLPQNWSGTLNTVVRKALNQAMDVAIKTVPNRPSSASNLAHKLAVGASGGIGGLFGLPALMIELPLSTTVMLRSIADIARSEGHDLGAMETRLQCLEVFALGSQGAKKEGAESSYWAVRTALAQALREAAAHLTQRGTVQKTAPAMVRFVTAISSRFGVVVSEQAAAKAVPVIGAAAGALINVMFMEHFQNMARGHFIIRRLEKRHGRGTVESAYNSFIQNQS